MMLACLPGSRRDALGAGLRSPSADSYAFLCLEAIQVGAYESLYNLWAKEQQHL